MKTEFLKEFATLATYGNFHLAAEKLFISQPTLSNHIKILEQELGFELFDRSRDNQLTVAGSIFLDGTQAALASIDSSLEACRNLLEAEPNTHPPVRLSIRVSRNQINAILEAHCPYPYTYAKYEMDRSLLYDFAHDLADIMCTHHVDRFPALKAEAERMGLRHAYLGKAPCAVIMAENNPLAQEPLTRERLRGTKIAILHVIEFAYWKSLMLDFLGADLGIAFAPIPVETPDNFRALDIKDMLLVLPTNAVNQYFSGREGFATRETIDGETFFVPESIVWRPREDNPNIEHVVELLRDCMKDQ